MLLLLDSELTNLSIDEVECHYDIVEFDAMTDNLILNARLIFSHQTFVTEVMVCR